MTDPLRVAIFLTRQVETGGQRYAVEVFSYLRRRGVRITPIYLDDYPKRYRRLGLVIGCLVCNLWVLNRARDLQLLDGTIFVEDVYLRPKLWLFNILIRLISGQLRSVALVQAVLTNHRLLQNRILRKLDDLLAWLFFRQACLVLTNSEFIRQRVLSRGVAPEKTRVIYCGYDSAREWSVEAAEGLWPHDNVQRILFVGQCEPYKGVDVLLRAVAQLDQDSGHAVVVDIVGNTATNATYYRLLRGIVETENLEGRVRFCGHVGRRAQLWRFYQAADIFVLPSRCEGFGIVLLEAMSFRLPIVATTAGAIPELIKDRRHGLLVPPDDPRALAQAIESLCDSADLRAEYGRNGYAFVRDKREFYSWEAVGERVLSNLQSLPL